MADAMDWIYIPHQLDKNGIVVEFEDGTSRRIYIPHQLDKNGVTLIRLKSFMTIYIPHQLDKNTGVLNGIKITSTFTFLIS